MRYFFTIAYKGTQYHGWQKQPNAIGVQQKIEEVFSTILNQKSEIVGSGRTDSGVHATAQVFHFDYSGELDPLQLVFKANKMLPKDVALKHAKLVKEEAHARFDAESRAYQYHIVTEKNPFAIDQAYFFTQELAIEKMNLAAEKLLNYQDFESFSKVKTDVFTFNCSIFEAIWKQEVDSLVFHIKANRFLRGMVRAIVGTLLDVGQHKISIENFEEIIKAKNRKSAGRAVPAHGLYLTEVQYPKDIYL
ncbi:tRNA pseudouridine synthase A [Marivirga tractuosa]|uniref:tRNA pseudouridine synthase A n=1 Tax=Marivirga tractuosa (strain ATCC 23168 / DSM 4126 / NBRC 15989 / NCIMB 1408 / VKM B-1430 / H-43) TaxID=643867 RepID=E4TV16_MARTH|nr:tRNA pseudouridine(38-40) synthase TruA [Marivirga tractuosa]ADR22109.1 tRNA pseudouridine synthase A [Marivirga tractuosa DSM 4126]BDD13429.1 tRNA pseudouridine synthase A [Marivirga tractuosa]